MWQPSGLLGVTSPTNSDGTASTFGNVTIMYDTKNA